MSSRLVLLLLVGLLGRSRRIGAWLVRDPDLIARMHDVTLELFRQPAAWKQQWRPAAEVAGLRGMHLVPSRVAAAEDIATPPDLGPKVTTSRLRAPGVPAPGPPRDSAASAPWGAVRAWS